MSAIYTQLFGLALKFVGFLLFQRAGHMEAKREFLKFANKMEKYGLAPARLHRSYVKQMQELQERIRAKKKKKKKV